MELHPETLQSEKKNANHVKVINSFDIKINISILVLPKGRETL